MSTEPSARPEQPGGAAFWVGAVVGLAVMAFGIRGILTNARATLPSEFVKWFVGADLLHDLLLAPLICLTAFGVARAVPPRARAPIASGLIASAFVVAVVWAPLRGYGRATVPDNATVQPLNYATGLTTVLIVVWTIALAWLAGGLVPRISRCGRSRRSGGTQARRR